MHCHIRLIIDDKIYAQAYISRHDVPRMHNALKKIAKNHCKDPWEIWIINSHSERSSSWKKVINTVTGEIFQSITTAAIKNGLSRKTLVNYLNNTSRNKTTLKYL